MQQRHPATFRSSKSVIRQDQVLARAAHPNDDDTTYSIPDELASHLPDSHGNTFTQPQIQAIVLPLFRVVLSSYFQLHCSPKVQVQRSSMVISHFNKTQPPWIPYQVSTSC
jgi:hypothetical protein